MPDPLYRLLAWLSPAYPIGAFSYSHGVETAVEEGFIKDRVSLVAWLETVLSDGTGRVDGALFAAAWRAAEAQDWPVFDAIAERAAAWRGTSEMALESRQQGGSFLSITRNAWPHPDLDAAHERLAGEIALPVAVALAAAVHGIALEMALERLSACLHRQPDFGGGPHRAARPDRRTIGAGGSRGAVHAAARAALAVTDRSTRSARRRRCSTGARCATKRNTRGSSAHDPARVAAVPPAGDLAARSCLVGHGRALAGSERGRARACSVGDGRNRMPAPWHAPPSPSRWPWSPLAMGDPGPAGTSS